MKKIFVSFLILSLILITAFIKNSTKRIDDEIFAIKENILSLKKDFENTKLVYDYLSSAEKLIEFHVLYFENELVKKDIQEIKILNNGLSKSEIKKLKFSDDK